jgi:hypothetical protein
MKKISALTLKICVCLLICNQAYAKVECPTGNTKYLLAGSVEVVNLNDTGNRNFNVFVCSPSPLDTEDAFNNAKTKLQKALDKDNVTILNVIPVKD